MQGKDLRTYFEFSRKERNGVLLLVLIVNAVWVLPFWFGSPKQRKLDAEELDLIAFRLTADQESDSTARQYREFPEAPGKSRMPEGTDANELESLRLFPFDPNRMTREQWQQMGVRDRTATTIIRYLAKGGKFREAADLRRIYGFREEDFQRLRPYISIPRSEKNSSQAGMTQSPSGFARTPALRTPTQAIDINTADSLQWLSLPGIGPYFAGRLVRFRESLGGFSDIEQVAECRGLRDSVFRSIKPLLLFVQHPEIRKLSLNRASWEELAAHPYISNRLARQIVSYRDQHGSFREMEDLLLIHSFTDSLYRRILPYLTIN